MDLYRVQSHLQTVRQDQCLTPLDNYWPFDTFRAFFRIKMCIIYRRDSLSFVAGIENVFLVEVPFRNYAHGVFCRCEKVCLSVNSILEDTVDRKIKDSLTQDHATVYTCKILLC